MNKKDDSLTYELKFKAGERFKLIRLLTGLTQDKFVKLLNIPYNRLANIETLRVKMSEDDFYKTCTVFPEFVDWLVYEGGIKVDHLSASDDPLKQMAGLKLSVGLLPDGYEDISDYSTEQ